MAARRRRSFDSDAAPGWPDILPATPADPTADEHRGATGPEAPTGDQAIPAPAPADATSRHARDLRLTAALRWSQTGRGAQRHQRHGIQTAARGRTQRNLIARILQRHFSRSPSNLRLAGRDDQLGYYSTLVACFEQRRPAHPLTVELRRVVMDLCIGAGADMASAFGRSKDSPPRQPVCRPAQTTSVPTRNASKTNARARGAA